MTRLSHIGRAEAADVFRRELAANWYTAGQVSRLLGSGTDNSSEMANARRRDGELLGVWIPHERAYRYPNWQFDALSRPMPQLREILSLLRDNGLVPDHGHRTTGWHEVQWFITPHALLQDRKPADVLAKDADAVVRAAKIEFMEEGHSVL